MMVLEKNQVVSFDTTTIMYKSNGPSRFSSTKYIYSTQNSSKVIRELSPGIDVDEDEDNEETGITAEVPNGDVFNLCKRPTRMMDTLKELKSTNIVKEYFEYDKTPIKDLTSLNFSSLFTFRKHMQSSRETFFKDYLFIGNVGKGNL